MIYYILKINLVFRTDVKERNSPIYQKCFK